MHRHAAGCAKARQYRCCLRFGLVGAISAKAEASARLLAILWTLGPVAFVYDVSDTEGKPFPPKLGFFLKGNSPCLPFG